MTDGKLRSRLGLRTIHSSYSVTTWAEPRNTARTVSFQLHRLSGTYESGEKSALSTRQAGNK